MHFIRRDGPRIFLDTRDLIGVLEKGAPVSVSELGRLLAKVSGRVVLVYTNVAELVPQTENKKADRARVRSLMRDLERLPLSYIRSQEISRHEFRAAVQAFEGGMSAKEVNPYVNQWWQIMSQIPAEYMRFIAPEKEAALKRMSLIEMVDHLVAENPEAFDSARLIDKHSRSRLKMIGSA
jgi:hypothetical protein